MIIQRKIHFNVPNGQENIYWEDLVINDSVVINILAYLKTLAHPIGTEYRIIQSEAHIQYAIVTQPQLPEKEVEWLKSK